MMYLVSLFERRGVILQKRRREDLMSLCRYERGIVDMGDWRVEVILRGRGDLPST